MTIQCCKCKRVWKSNAWLAVDTPLQGPVSHTYCPSCYIESCLEFFSTEASSARFAAAYRVSELINGL